MTRRQLLKLMWNYDACEEATRWVKKTKGTPEELVRKAIFDINHSDWVEWLVEKVLIAHDKDEDSCKLKICIACLNYDGKKYLKAVLKLLNETYG